MGTPCRSGDDGLHLCGVGSLPVAVTLLIYLTSPDYIGLLFTTLTGNLVLAASGIWMLIGCLVMRKMINFDF